MTAPAPVATVRGAGMKLRLAPLCVEDLKRSGMVAPFIEITASRACR